VVTASAAITATVMVAIGVAAVPAGITPAVAVAVAVAVVVQPPNRGSGGKDGSHARGFGRYPGTGSASTCRAW